MAGYRDLTIPVEGSTSAREVLSRALGSLLDDLRGLDPSLATPGPSRQGFIALRAAVAQALRSDPGAVFSALRRPTVGVLIRCLRLREPGDGAASEMIESLTNALAIELARADVLDAPLRTVPSARVPCLSGRFVLAVPENTDALVFSSAEVTMMSSSGARSVALDGKHPALETPYHPIDDDLVLALFDDNPLALEEAHPDKEGNAISLGGRSVDEWLAALREALSIIGEYLPAIRDELRFFLQQVVPVGYHEESHLSASYRESIGTVYLSLHPQPMTMAEALIHEFSHNKLGAFLEREAVLDNAFSPLFTSPVRPDPRPLHGVLLAVHAFFPVARLYERMIEAGHPWAGSASFRQRYEEIIEKNHEGARTLLENGRFTAAGATLREEIRALDQHFGRA